MNDITITLSAKVVEELQMLARIYAEIYGDEETTIWKFDDVEEMRKIGGEFIEIVLLYLNKHNG